MKPVRQCREYKERFPYHGRSKYEQELHCYCGDRLQPGVQAKANTIAVTYSGIGGSTGPMVVTGTTLTFDSLLTLSVLSGNPNLNAVWNPVISSDHNVVDLTTGLLNATVSWTFADGATLSGTLFEDVNAFLTGTGTFTSTYTFTGGTGEFAGSTGSLSGGGVVGPNEVPASGSGTINAPAIPEPASAALLLGGFAAILFARRQSKVKSSSV
jgi:hypothetical protein